VERPERDAADREPDELDSLIDEFGDRSGPDPALEPDVEVVDDEDAGDEPPDGA
jgi:hypothetical protein